MRFLISLRFIPSASEESSPDINETKQLNHGIPFFPGGPVIEEITFECPSYPYLINPSTLC